MSFQERLLPAGGGDPVHRPARIRHPEREQQARHRRAAETDLHPPSRPRPPHPAGVSAVRTPAPAPGLPRSGSCAAVRRHIGAPPDRTRPYRVLLDQPIDDSFGRMPQLARRIQISPQDPVDDRLGSVQPRRPRRQTVIAASGPPTPTPCPPSGGTRDTWYNYTHSTRRSTPGSPRIPGSRDGGSRRTDPRTCACMAGRTGTVLTPRVPDLKCELA